MFDFVSLFFFRYSGACYSAFTICSVLIMANGREDKKGSKRTRKKKEENTYTHTHSHTSKKKQNRSKRDYRSMRDSIWSVVIGKEQFCWELKRWCRIKKAREKKLRWRKAKHVGKKKCTWWMEKLFTKCGYDEARYNSNISNSTSAESHRENGQAKTRYVKLN